MAGISRGVAAWKARVQPDGPEPAEPERSLHLSQTPDDRWVLDGTLDAEGGSVVAAALRVASTDDTDVAVPRRPAGPMPWWGSALSSSTTSAAGAAAATGPTSTWSSS